MKPDDLTYEERLALCARAEHACASRLRRIADWTDPTDEPVRRLLRSLADEWQPWLDTLTARELRVRHDPEGDARVAIAAESALRRLRSSLGETPMDRDAALFHAEQVEEAACELYRCCSALSEGDPEIFRRAADWRRERLRRLKTVLLPVASSGETHED
jgi:hypothetical protein